MQILYSHRTRSADGQYVHIRALTDALRARGCPVAICGPGEDGDRAATRRLDAAGRGGAAARAWPAAALYEAAELGYSAVGYRRLARVAASLPSVDVLYERYNLFYHAGARFARARGLPFILEVNAPLADERATNGGLALRPVAHWSEAGLWRAADAVLPVTGVLAAKATALGVAPDRVTVIQNGVDDDFLAPANGAAIREAYGLGDRLVLGFTGFVRDWHGVDRILTFMARSDRDDLHLLLVGDGPAREALTRQAAAAGLAERFTVTGVVQRDAMPEHVAAFDIALQPASVAYASPLKLFEYMAAAKPILAPAQANIQETLTDGEDAVLFDPADQDALPRALAALIDDDGLRARLGAAARETLLRRKLTWAHNAERVEAIARSLIERRAAA
ncbi:MAG: glycosyltransferase family 4 protein [Pseudomonadota bacterium]